MLEYTVRLGIYDISQEILQVSIDTAYITMPSRPLYFNTRELIKKFSGNFQLKQTHRTFVYKLTVVWRSGSYEKTKPGLLHVLTDGELVV